MNLKKNAWIAIAALFVLLIIWVISSKNEQVDVLENQEEVVEEKNLEIEILNKVGLDKKKTVVIRGDQNVPYKSVMKVIDIANKNKLKMILAVKGK